MSEFTGTYWKCDKCSYLFDWEDTHCPECGSDECSDINIHEEQEKVTDELAALKIKKREIDAMIKMHE